MIISSSLRACTLSKTWNTKDKMKGYGPNVHVSMLHYQLQHLRKVPFPSLIRRHRPHQTLHPTRNQSFFLRTILVTTPNVNHTYYTPTPLQHHLPPTSLFIQLITPQIPLIASPLSLGSKRSNHLERFICKPHHSCVEGLKFSCSEPLVMKSR